jgi:hypothetical protein
MRIDSLSLRSDIGTAVESGIRCDVTRAEYSCES